MSSSPLGLQRKGWWKLVPQETTDRSIPSHSKNEKRSWSPTAPLHPLKYPHSILRIVSLTAEWDEFCKINLRDCPSLFVTRSIDFRLRKTLLTECPQAQSYVLVTLFVKAEEKKYRSERLYRSLLSGSMTVKLKTTASLQLFRNISLFLFNNLSIYVL